MNEERLKEIIRIARKLDWIYPISKPNSHHFSYPLMQLSEVEKCMIALYDDDYLNRMKKWEREIDDGTYARKMEEAKQLIKRQNDEVVN